jgi:hypothetical protein
MREKDIELKTLFRRIFVNFWRELLPFAIAFQFIVNWRTFRNQGLLSGFIASTRDTDHLIPVVCFGICCALLTGLFLPRKGITTLGLSQEAENEIPATSATG